MPKLSQKKTDIASSKYSTGYRVLLRARITEKAHAALALNKYVSQVALDATKRQIKLAVESVYGVSVKDVHITRIPRRRRYFGRTPGWKSSLKKATVTLKEGESIDLFRE